MMKYKIILLGLLISFCACKEKSNPAVDQPKIELQDLELLMGEWTGSLTYLDYTTNNPYTMPADLHVEKGSNSHELIFNHIYPNEASANGSGKLIISEDGTIIDDQQIISKTSLASGEIEIITEQVSEDNDKKAMIKRTYLISQSNYSEKKEVLYHNSKDWIVRNETKYKRK